MAIVFHPPRGTNRAGVVNALRLQTWNELQLRLSGGNPTMPLDASHMTMAYAYALADLGIWIGVGPGEVAPDRAMEALNDGLAKTRPDAMKDIRERLAQYADQAVSSAE